MGTAALLCRRRCRGAVALAGSGASLAVHPRITIGNPAVLGIVGVTSPDGPPSKQSPEVWWALRKQGAGEGGRGAGLGELGGSFGESYFPLRPPFRPLAILRATPSTRARAAHVAF